MKEDFEDFLAFVENAANSLNDVRRLFNSSRCYCGNRVVVDFIQSVATMLRKEAEIYRSDLNGGDSRNYELKP